MSDALKYLMQLRPEAMENYFSFIKKSGEHLDEKTKAIISVITKVDKQTDRGFRQYLNRALKAGVTPDEIIDALFVAFPTLGLSKIVWATDILLDMDIPEFQLDEMQARAEWHTVMSKNELQTGASYLKDCDGKDLFVYYEDDIIKVYDNICPHQSTRIPGTAITNLEITCPLHKWKFDITSGNCIDKGDSPLRCFESKIENNLLKVFW